MTPSYTHIRFCALLLLLPCLAQAALEFETTRLDLKVTAGTRSLDATYPFKNAGKTPIRVLDISSSCGCTVPQLAKRDYAPGETGVLKVHFDIGDRQGLQSKTIKVLTDDGSQTLQLVADIPQRLLITPRLVLFRPGDTEKRTLRLEFRSDTPVRNVRVTDIPPNFDATLVTEKDGTDYTITLGLLTQPAGDLRATLFVRSTTASGLEYADAFFLRFVP